MKNKKVWFRFATGFIAMMAMTAFGLAFLVVVTDVINIWIEDLVGATIIAAAAPILASLSLNVWSSYRSQMKELQVDHRTRRGKAYESFLSYLFEAITTLDDETQPDELEMDAAEYARFVQEMLVWGSDELIQLWNEFRDVEFDELTHHEQREWYGRLLEQVHRELRGSEPALSWEDLYRLYSYERQKQRNNGERRGDGAEAEESRSGG